MEYQAFVEQVVGRAQFDEPAAAIRAIEACLYGLAQPLPAHVVQEVARRLPDEMANAMRSASVSATRKGVVTALDLYAVVSERTGLPLSHALEQTQVVCSVLAERLDPDLVGRLSRELPDEIGALLTKVEHAPLAPAAHLAAHGQTLAEGKPGATHSLSGGKPGSSHPLSEAQPAKAHTHSVTEDDPHQDSKVSSAHGLTQEREHETLAEGRGKRS